MQENISELARTMSFDQIEKEKDHYFKRILGTLAVAVSLTPLDVIATPKKLLYSLTGLSIGAACTFASEYRYNNSVFEHKLNTVGLDGLVLDQSDLNNLTFLLANPPEHYTTQAAEQSKDNLPPQIIREPIAPYDWKQDGSL